MPAMWIDNLDKQLALYQGAHAGIIRSYNVLFSFSHL